MNPLITSKRARRLLTALAAISGIFLTMGCGDNGSIRSLGGGFSKASLNGQYVISQTGTALDSQGVNLQPFTEAIVFTADGSGNLSITADDGNQGGGTFPPLNPSPETGTYNINSDGTGSLIFNNIPNNYAITMIDDSHFYIVEQDQFATSSGLGEKQDTSAFTAAPSGPFVFKAHEVNTSSRVGGVTIAAGAITGTEDLLSFGLLSSSHPVSTTVAMSAPDSNGRGTFTLSDGSSWNYYVVNANKFYFISNIGSVEAGQAETQSGSFSLATLADGNSYVFGSSGDTSNVLGIHSAGVFTTDGNGGITDGAVDFVQDATVNADLAVSGGTYTLASTGRGQINLTLTGGSISPQIFWMVDGTRAYFLANNSAAVEDGTFSQQQGAPFTVLSNQATFLMDGFDVSFKDRVGAFEPTTGGFNWNQAANAFDTNLGLFNPSVTGTSGTYQVSPNGRVTATVNGVTSSLVFYMSSDTSGFMVQEDADIGGVFTQQATQ